jgi:hypothetical protein
MGADDPCHQDEIFTLKTTDEPCSYEQSKTVKDDKKPGDSYLDLEYTCLIPDKNYTLTVKSGGSSDVLFDKIPFAYLMSLSRSDAGEQPTDNPIDESSNENDPAMNSDSRDVLITEGEPEGRNNSLCDDAPELDNEVSVGNNDFPADIPNPFDS